MGAQAIRIELGDIVQCCQCGVAFSFDETLHGRRYKDGKLFWCPNGHQQHYGDTEAKRLRRELEAKEAEVEHQRKRIQWAQKATENEKNRHRGTKGVLTKTRKRVSNGVCPCCKRMFANLARHMKCKHPQFAAAAERDDG